MGSRSARSFASKSKSAKSKSSRSATSSKSSARSGHIELTTGRSTDDLQQAVGNASVARMLQRKGDHASDTRGRKATAKKSPETNGEIELLTMMVDFVLSTTMIGPQDVEGLSAEHQRFVARLYQVVHNRPFDKTGKESDFTAASREADLNVVEAMLPKVVGELQSASTGKALGTRLSAAVRNATSDIVRNAVWVHSREDGLLAAQLVSPPAQEARESALKALNQTYDLANKLLVAPADAIDGKFLSDAGKDVNEGIGVLFKVIKSVDPAEYRKSVDEARKYCAKHGVALGLTKSLQVVAEITDLTAGTVVSASSAISKYVVKAFGAGADLKALEALEKGGELLSSGNKVALRFAQIGKYLDTADKALSVLSVAGGYAKLVTAESWWERAEGVVDVSTGVLALAGKLTGDKLVFGLAGGTLSTVASAITLPWMGVKFVKYLGELGGDAIEGSLYGGLYEELREIQPFGDEVSRDLMVLATAVDERDRRAGQGAQGERAAGADEAVEDAARKLRKSLVAAANRVLQSRIDAVGRTLPESVQTAIEWAIQPDYPPEALVSAAGDLLAVLASNFTNAADVVLEMAVDQGFIDRDEVAEKRAAMRAKG